MADENFGIIVEVDPRKALDGQAQVDRGFEKNENSAREFEVEAKRALAEVAKAAKAAAREQERAATTAARAGAAAQRQAAKDVEEIARAATIAAERRAKQREEVDRRMAARAKQSADAQKATIDHLAAGYKSIVGPLAEYNQKLSLAIQLERRGAISAQQRAQYVRGLQREIDQHNAKQQGGFRGAVSEIAGSQIGAIAGPAAAAAAAIAAGREVIALSDAYANLTNRIRTVTDSEAQAIRVRGDLLALANRTRSDVGATAEGYVRLAAATKSLGLTQSELLSFTESLNKTIKLSGATGAEAQAGLIQFAQGLGAGALRGDELRSVMEQLGPVADVIAKKLGTTRAGLKAFGEQGKITADIVVAAFREQREEIDGKFGKTIATFSDLWTVLHNAIEAAVGQIVEATGGLPALGSAVTAVATEIGEFAHGVSVSIKLMMDMERGAVSLALKLGGVAGALDKLSSGKLGGVLTGNLFGNIGGFSDKYINTGNILDDLRGTDLEKQIAANEAAAKQEILDAQRRQFVATDPQARREALEAFAKVGQRITDSMYDEAKATAAAAKAQRDHERAIRDAAAAWKEWLGGVSESGAGVLERVKLRLDDVRDSVTDSTAAAIEAARAQQAFNDNVSSLADRIGGKISGAFGSVAQAAELTVQQFEEMEPRMSAVSEAFTQQLGGAIGSTIDALIELNATGKASFSDLIRSMLVDLEQLLARMMIFQGLKSVFGFGTGAGSFGSVLAGSLGIGGFTGFAAGGTVVAGGSGGVDSVPFNARVSPGERITFTPPGREPRDGGDAPQPVNVNAIIVADQEAAALAALSTPAGTRAIISTIAANAGAVRAAVGR